MTHRFRLLQAREPDEIVRGEEHQAFADRLDCAIEHVDAYDLLHQPLDVEQVIDGVDAVLVGGSGRYGVLDDTPWMHPFVDLMGELAQRQFPTFASCFGFQALGLALGAEVARAPDRSEVGTYEVALTPDGAADPVFGTLSATFEAQFGHKDSVMALPSGAVHLASSDRCPMQALRVGTRVYATQFHPELTMEENRLRFERYAAIYNDYEDVRFVSSPEPCTLLSRFVASVL